MKPSPEGMLWNPPTHPTSGECLDKQLVLSILCFSVVTYAFFFFFFFLCQVSIILCSFPSIFWCSFMMWRLFCLACEDCRQGIIQAPCSFRFKDWSVLLLVAVSPFLILVNVSQLISFGLLAWYPALWKPCLDLCLSWCMHGHSQ